MSVVSIGNSFIFTAQKTIIQKKSGEWIIY
ncbi:MAG: hypothetical protein K0Q82_662 [Chryseobacterium indoltheticum]|jgi:hypothetical protein|nr:hypothetical protein [Chryseobacterium indoltheticum]